MATAAFPAAAAGAGLAGGAGSGPRPAITPRAEARVRASTGHVEAQARGYRARRALQLDGRRLDGVTVVEQVLDRDEGAPCPADRAIQREIDHEQAVEAQQVLVVVVAQALHA